MNNPLPKFPILEVHKADGIEGFACFTSTEGEIENPAIIGLNLEALLGTVVLGDVEPAELPYFIADSIMHEVIHALEQWAKVEFNEERIEQLIEKYRKRHEREENNESSST